MNYRPDYSTPKNRDVRRLSAYHERENPSPSFDVLLKEIEERRHHPFRKWYAVAGIFLFLLAGGFFFIWQNVSLRVVLIPKKTTIHPDGQIIVLPSEKISARIPLEGVSLPFTKKKVETYARGTLVVYNAYNADPYRFVARTRFESPDGSIYRIEKTLLIPGATKKDGKLIPGSIEVEVAADQPGEAYNKEFSDFTIPGLKESPLFEKFYARSKGSITGGRVGEEQVIDRQALSQEEFTGKERVIVERLRAQVPEGFFLPEAAWKINYYGDTSPPEAEITGWMAKRHDVGVKLASLFFDSGEAERVILFDDTRLSLTSTSFPEDIARDAVMRVIAHGEATYAEHIVKEEVPNALANLHSPEDIDAFLKNLGSVESATLIFSPAFLKRVPSNPNRITIDVAQ